jgi:hypothetical protein
MVLQHKLQQCLHGATLTQVAAIVAKHRSEFYFRQRLLQIVSQKIRLHGWLYIGREMFHATCVATPLRDKLQRKLHGVSAP